MKFGEKLDAALPKMVRSIDSELRQATGENTGFVLLVFPLGRAGSARVCSNVSGDGIRIALRGAINTVDLGSGESLENVH